MTADYGSAFERGTDGPRMIVVGIDGSDSSMRAGSYAAGLARRQHSFLAVVYIQPVGGTVGSATFAGALAETGQQVAEELEAQLRAAFETVSGVYHIRWRFYTLRGDPFHGLVATADKLKADAVVVGASEGFGHRVIGSIALRLVKTGRWPVTVVP
jgi:nucleotide-binding universal stress UspA family protein